LCAELFLLHEEGGKGLIEPEEDPEKIIGRLTPLISEAATDRDVPDPAIQIRDGQHVFGTG
jgi:hypothetical protein